MNNPRYREAMAETGDTNKRPEADKLKDEAAAKEQP